MHPMNLMHPCMHQVVDEGHTFVATRVDHGMGVVARRPIAQGEVIMADVALLTTRDTR